MSVVLQECSPGVHSSSNVTFWEAVEKDHTQLLTRSDYMYDLFCLWIIMEQELEETAQVSSSKKKASSSAPNLTLLQRRRRASNVHRGRMQSVIYEEAFSDIVTYFVNLINQDRENWTEFRVLESFDAFDISDCGLVTREAVYIVLCLISAKQSKKLSLFLQLFGPTFFEIVSGAKKSRSRTIHISSVRQLSFLAGIQDMHVTHSFRSLEINMIKPMNYKTFELLYSDLFHKYDNNLFTSKAKKPYVTGTPAMSIEEQLARIRELTSKKKPEERIEKTEIPEPETPTKEGDTSSIEEEEEEVLQPLRIKPINEVMLLQEIDQSPQFRSDPVTMLTPVEETTTPSDELLSIGNSPIPDEQMSSSRMKKEETPITPKPDLPKRKISRPYTPVDTTGAWSTEDGDTSRYIIVKHGLFHKAPKGNAVKYLASSPTSDGQQFTACGRCIIL